MAIVKRNGSRVVLEGVAKVGYGTGMYCQFPASFKSALEALGESVSYDTAMAVTGGAFRRTWNRDDGGNVCLTYFSPEPEVRGFRALGYSFTALPPVKADMVKAIKASIDRGVPVIAFGPVGPPEAALITGYDDDGETLLGYSFFQDPALPDMYEQHDWYEQAIWAGDKGLLLIGDKVARPTERETLIQTLRFAVDLARTAERPTIPDHVCGLAAYDAWAAGLEIDADYPEDTGVLQHRLMIHGDQVLALGDRRHGAAYLRSSVAIAPEIAGELTAAADLLMQVADMPGIWLWGDAMTEEDARGLADHDTRVSIAAAVRRARALETQAVELIEAALQRVG